MKMKLKAMKPRPKTYAKMRDAMLEIWAGLTDKLREDLVVTFRDRLKKVLLSKGDLLRFSCFFTPHDKNKRDSCA